MANITDKTAQIRQAVYGKDVRESIASGIEAISNQQDSYEQDLTSRQNTYETDLTNQQNSFQTSITNQENTYQQSLTDRQNTFETNINNAEDTRVGNENTRIFNEDNRKANENTRQQTYNEFRDFVNTATSINRVPYLFDGGDFGDISTPVLILNGGDF